MKTKMTFLIVFFLTGFPMLLSAQMYVGSHMKQETIDEFGTKVFNASAEVVINAVKAAFIDHDYDLGIEKPEKGEIRTKRKLLSATGDANHAVFYYRQYIATITEKEPGKTTVVLTPKMFLGENDISEKKCWVIKGNKGEIKLWEVFFKDIQDQLE